MADTAVIEPRASARGTGRGSTVGMGLAMLIAIGFLAAFAFPYFTLNQQRFGMYWPRRGWLLLHILPGMVALIIGPVQLWLGINRRRLTLHRKLGYTYMTCGAASVIGAYYLAFHTDGPWVFGMGLVGLATAWIVTTGLAFVAIRRRAIQQHREWMIRSCVVTFGFVTFRLLVGILQGHVQHVWHVCPPVSLLGIVLAHYTTVRATVR